MNVIITGGAGFIGSHLAELLNKSKKIKKIIIIDNFEDGTFENLKGIKNSKKIKIVSEDILNFKKIVKFFRGIDVVFHLAALSDIVPSINDPKKYIETNFNGTLNVLEAIKVHKVKKIIYSASSSCYGFPKKFPTSENSELNPKYPYSFSKLEAERLIIHYSEIFNINFISLRLFNVFGTRSRTNSSYGAVLGVFLSQKLNNKPLTIVGDGNQKRDFIYVSDVCDAFFKCIDPKHKNLILNVGTGKPKTVNELANLISNKKVFIPKRPGEPDITQADIAKIKNTIKWKPKVEFKDGLEIVFKNIQYWSNTPVWSPEKIKKTTKNWFKYIGKNVK